MGLIPIDEVVYFDVTTHNASTGAVSDADSPPTFDVFEENTDTPILDDQAMTKRTSLTGDYRGTFTTSAANGFEAGKWYSVVVSATVSSVAAKYVAMHFRAAPAESVAGAPKVDASHAAGTAWGSGAITAGTFAANAINAAKLDPDVTTELQAGLATAANLATVAGYLDTEIAAILADTNELQTDWANGGRLDLLIDAIKAKTDVIPASPAAVSDVPTAAANAAALMDLSNGIETSITPRQALRLILAASAGKLSGAATTTVTIRNVGDSKNRITATVDSDGNRSAVTVDAT